jgi:hypothetical protein
LVCRFCVARVYADDILVTAKESVKVNGGAAIYPAAELAWLLAHVPADALPALVIGAGARPHEAEIPRLDWRDLNFATRSLAVGADHAKTSSRHVVPILDNLAAWLAPYARQTGRIWG